MANTTIQISNTLKEALSRRKLFEKETYEELIWDLLEDSMEINKETKEDIAKAREEYNKGKYKTLAQVKEELGL